MGEVAVAFPRDETAGEVIASRLRADGIPARVDRGLAGSWQVGPVGQTTVLVDERYAERARDIVGMPSRDDALPTFVLQAAIVIVVLLIVFAVFVVFFGPRAIPTG